MRTRLNLSFPPEYEYGFAQAISGTPVHATNSNDADAVLAVSGRVFTHADFSGSKKRSLKLRPSAIFALLTLILFVISLVQEGLSVHQLVVGAAIAFFALSAALVAYQLKVR